MTVYRCQDPEADWIADQLLLAVERLLWRLLNGEEVSVEELRTLRTQVAMRRAGL